MKNEEKNGKMVWTGPAASTPAPGHPVTYYGSYTKDDGNQYPTGNRAGPSREDQEQDEFDESLVPYRSAGIVGRDEMRDLAAIMGPSALATVEAALLERAAESVALVMVPGEPPGKVLSDFLRRVASHYSRVAVCVYPGSLSPERVAELLSLGLPDVESKLQVHEIDAPTLASAIEQGEEGSVRAGHPVDVYVPASLSASVQREISGGQLSVDPTVVRLVPEQVPQDDPDRIRHALQQPTDMVAKQVLDPHVFSDPRGIDRYRHALGEGIVREFLKDISPNASREEGADVIRGIVERCGELLAKRGIDIHGMKFLGMGNNGLAWELSDGRVLKVTTDDAEAAVAVHLKGKAFKHIFHVYDVWAFPGEYEGHRVYGLLTEKGLKKPSELDRGMFWGLLRALREFSPDPDDEFDLSDLGRSLRTMMADEEYPAKAKQKVLELVKRFDLAGMSGEFARLGVEPDLHPGNIMQRPDGSFVVIDIGTGGDQEKAKPPFIEQRKKRVREAFRGPSQVDERAEPEYAINFIEAYAQKLAKRGIRVTAHQLGEGSQGTAFKTVDNRAFKVTTDESEAIASLAIMHHPGEHLVKIFDVFKFPDDEDQNVAYGILEELLTPLSPQEQDELHVGITSRGFGDDVVQGLIRKFCLKEMAAELEAAGVHDFHDFHPGNIMKRGTTYVLIDPGYSRPTGGEPPILEVGIGSYPQNMQPRPGGNYGRMGNQSGAWSSGRLVLRKPQDHVPVDDEDDERLDTEYGLGTSSITQVPGAQTH